jgi:glycosyltransferase involved in cell wall biosynthesis
MKGNIPMPKISIIVTQYNAEQYLNHCVDSILNQTFKDFELIIVDNGSNDASGAICDSYAEKDARVKVVHKEHGDISTGRNVGLDNANGNYITFVDSDDWISPVMYEILYKEIIQNKADAVSCKFIRGSEKKFKFDNSIPKYKISILNSDEAIKLFYYSMIEVLLWNILVKKEIYDSFRIPNLGYMDDHYMIPKIFYNINKLAIVDVPLYYYFQNPLSISHKKSNLREYEDSYISYKSNIDYFIGKNQEYYFLAEKSLLDHIFNWIGKVINNRDLDIKLFNSKFKIYFVTNKNNILHNKCVSKKAKIIMCVGCKSIELIQMLLKIKFKIVNKIKLMNELLGEKL